MAGSDSSTDNPDRYVLFRYQPSFAAAILFSALFFLTTAFHIYQSFRKRAWFLIPFIIGGIFSTAGYTARILCSKDQWALGPFLTQSLVLLLAPALFAASIYMILGRIILLVGGEHFSPIRRTWMTKLFVAGDILSFWIQGVGGGIMASGEPQKLKTGEYIIIGGLLLQVIVFGLFVVVAVIFQRRGRELLAQVSKQVPWKRHLYTLYGTSILILVRSLVRVIEYIQGNNGYLLRHEVFLYVFDALLMFTVMVAMNFANPGDIALMLKEKRSCELTEELREMETSQERTVNTRAAWV